MGKLIYFSIVLAALSCTTPTDDQPKSKAPSSSFTKDFTITNLYDAFGNPDEVLVQDFGFSALIRYKGKTILFDAGTNADILKQNAQALGIDLSSVDFAVASHAHGDHINGFDYLLQVNPEVLIYLPFDFYAGARIDFNITGKELEVRDSLPIEMQYFAGQKDLGITINQSGRFWNAKTKFVSQNFKIEQGIELIATRSPYLGYCSKYPSVEEIQGAENAVEDSDITFGGLPELSLTLSTDQGEVILVGCSHSSVQNIIKETKQVTNRPIHMVFGGYHMLPYERGDIMTVAQYLKHELGVAKVAPTHCTGHLAFKILKDLYQDDYLIAGLGKTITIVD